MKRYSTVILFLCSLSFSNDKCVQIFYDKVPKATPVYNHGRAQAMLLENLIGHFPHIQQYVAPIESYQKGAIEKCDVSFYLGSYYDNPVPSAFLEDYAETSKPVVWLGYNFWQLGAERLKDLWQVEFVGLSELDWKHPDKKGQPGFHRYFGYKGKTFTKYGAFSNPAEGQGFNAAFEIALLRTLARNTRNVLVWAQHSSVTKNKVPYVLQTNHKWLVGEIPFSYINEEDRYLIFADLLFDMLNEKPRYPGKKPAFVRLEDVHAKVQQWQLRGFLEMAKRQDIKFGISLIPIFADPLGVMSHKPDEKRLRLNSTVAEPLVQFLKDAEKSGASFIMHGATHQYGETKNPFNGLSGADYEFWNISSNSGVAEDSPKYVIEKMEDGLQSMAEAGLSAPMLWVTPHYRASSLDFALFSQLFSFSAGRYDYRPMKKSGGTLPHEKRFDVCGAACNGSRLEHLEGTKLELSDASASNGLFYPYEIYGDVFGARLIPEDVGFVQPVDGNMGEKVANVKDLIEIVKRNSVLRDVWASFFLHPYLLDTKANGGIAATAGDTKDLEELIRAVKDHGYEFIDLKTWVPEHKAPLRKPTIETF